MFEVSLSYGKTVRYTPVFDGDTSIGSFHIEWVAGSKVTAVDPALVKAFFMIGYEGPLTVRLKLAEAKHHSIVYKKSKAGRGYPRSNFAPARSGPCCAPWIGWRSPWTRPR